MIIQKASRLDHIQEYFFSRKLAQIQELESQGFEVINLGIGGPDLPPPGSVMEAAGQALLHPKSHGYSVYRSSPELRKAFSEWLKRTYEVRVQWQNEVLPLLGSKEGILYLTLAFVNPGDKVLVPNPGYPTYTSAAHLAQAQVLSYELTQENGWYPDFDSLKAMDLRGVKLMWVNYPHMPTGQQANAELFQKLVAFGKEHHILICHDNPYGLVLPQQKPLSLLKFDPSLSVVAELNSLSKSFNMAGWRVGVLFGSKELIDTVVVVKSQVDSGMFYPVQVGAIEALALHDEWRDELNGLYRRRRSKLEEIFKLLGFTFDPQQVGLFLWAKAPSHIPDVVQYLEEVLVKAKVFITPGIIFGSHGERYARLSLCASEEKLDVALKRLQELVL